ncbi:hypothetical protein CLM62_40780 [Streptomyces sp. SA15]|uniref:hypothetical protein n=1 Tax=Streptomyces sp. SA15 TaxID=934019 RepID=UPI000BAF3DD8|nr:hypothetical protein [Streptomyces sp. SA15]PAZ10490.1 hypothetical protein CLM62_40780 [Streptomyces sp. SA15]
MTFHVRMQFTPGGPAVEGTWAKGETALDRYREWVGSHGSLEQIDDGRVHPIRTWTKEHGEEPLSTPPTPTVDRPDGDAAVSDVT